MQHLRASQKKERKKQEFAPIRAKIREILGNDNWLTQKSVKEILRLDGLEILASKSSKLTHSIGLRRKKLKKADVMFPEPHRTTWAIWAEDMLNSREQTFVLLDESGFNLHISNNYGYSMPNVDAIIAVEPSREKNISLCGLFFIRCIVKYELVDG